MASDQSPAKTVLIVDDYPEMRDLLRVFFEQNGYRVVEAANGREGVESARREQPDLILMDLNMPVLDGITAIRDLREVAALREVPVVIITAYGERGIELYAKPDALVQDNLEYLPKPFDWEQLKETLARLLPRN